MPRPLPPSRFRRVGKWVAFGPVLVSLAIWIVSYSGIVYAPQTKRHQIMLAGGVVMLHWQERSMPTDLPVEDSRDYRSWAEPLGPTDRITVLPTDSSSGPRASRYEPGIKNMGIEITQMTWIPKYRFNGRVDTHVVIAPTYLPLACIVFAAAALWFRDRRTIKPGHCPHCGYNLTGNESGVCPECATAVPRQETTA